MSRLRPFALPHLVALLGVVLGGPAAWEAPRVRRGSIVRQAPRVAVEPAAAEFPAVEQVAGRAVVRCSRAGRLGSAGLPSRPDSAAVPVSPVPAASGFDWSAIGQAEARQCF